MIQLFDTHRLSYRNAKLRAWALADKTRRVNFQDYSSEDDEWNDVGTDVITDESGYLFYADGTQKIECLGVAEAAIVDVSLDGGLSYLIQFVIHADHDPSALTQDDIHPLMYWNENGVQAQYNPLTAGTALPDYLLKTEYSRGDWAEGTIIVPNGKSDYIMNDWTHLIIITDSTQAVFKLPLSTKLRSGQVVTIYTLVDYTLLMAGVGGSHSLKAGHVYLMFNTFDLSPAGPSVVDVTAMYEPPALSTLLYTPALNSDGNHIWTATSIAANKTKQELVYGLDIPAGAVTGHINDINIKAVQAPFEYDEIPVTIYNINARSEQAGLEIKIWLNLYSDTGNYLGKAPIYDATKQSWTADTYYKVLRIQYRPGTNTVPAHLIVDDNFVEIE